MIIETNAAVVLLSVLAFISYFLFHFVYQCTDSEVLNSSTIWLCVWM